MHGVASVGASGSVGGVVCSRKHVREGVARRT